MTPTGAFWWDLLGRLLLESSGLIALAAVVSRKLLPQQQRVVWQVALSALLLLVAVEATGLHQRVDFTSSQAGLSTSRQLTIEVLPGPQIAAPARTQPHIPAKPSLTPWLPGIIWLAVAGGILARAFGSRLLFVALKLQRRPLNDPALQQTVDELVRLMKLRGRVHLSESNLLAGPIAFGLLRRCICVPDGFTRNHRGHEQKVMIAHELAHLSVRDPLWYAIMDCAVAVFWFNPLVWFGRARFQAACETAADEASLLVPEDGPGTLAECLVQLGKRMVRVKSYGWIGIEGKRFRSTLGRRVNRLLKINGTSWRPLPRWWTVATCCVGVVFCVGMLASSAAFARGRTFSLAERLWQLRLAGRGAPTEPLRAQVSQVGHGQRTLYTRFFKVDAPRFEQSVREFVESRQIPAGDSFLHDLKFFIESAGVELTPPAQMFYNSRLGTLMVRAELEELDAVEKLVQAVNIAPPQLTIEARFVEFQDPLDTLDLYDLAIGGEESGTNAFRGILPPSRYWELMKRLEARTGVDILTTPKVTTLSGRQAQIKVVDIRYIVTDLDFSGGETNGPQPKAEPFEFGPVLDVVPVLQPDGVSIDLKLISTIREFIGYDLERKYFDSGPPKPLTPVPLREYARENNASPGGPMNSTSLPNIMPLPIFRLRQAQTTARVWDGQTVVLKLSVIAASLAKPNVKFAPSGKTCFLFVTPTLIDPAGNRLHDESTLPAVEQTVPQ